MTMKSFVKSALALGAVLAMQGTTVAQTALPNDAASLRLASPGTVSQQPSRLRQQVGEVQVAVRLADQPLALAVGRHAAQKGFDLLAHAWVRVLQSVPQARLRVIGEGPLRAEHEALAHRLGVSDSIEWLAPTSQIERHYREAAVFVLSSRYEGMPLALLEAQALGVPAVAFDCPTGPAEIVTPQTGRLVAAGTAEAGRAGATAGKDIAGITAWEGSGFRRRIRRPSASISSSERP